MIEFQAAIQTALTNAQKLLAQATAFQVEEAVLSDDNRRYEITLSYDLQGKDPLAIESTDNKLPESSIFKLARLMRYRREYKTFYIDSKNGDFKGFKIKTQS